MVKLSTVDLGRFLFWIIGTLCLSVGTAVFHGIGGFLVTVGLSMLFYLLVMELIRG